MHQHMTGRQSFCLKGAPLTTTLGFTADVAAESRLLICTNCTHTRKSQLFAPALCSFPFFCQGLDWENYPDRLEFVQPTQTQEFTLMNGSKKEKKVRYKCKKKLLLADIEWLILAHRRT